LAVPLHAGPVQTLALAPAARRVVVGSGATTQVVISAHDAFGNPVTAEGTVAQVDGQAAPIQVTAAGQGALSIAAPARYVGTDHTAAAAARGSPRPPRETRLPGGPPARLTLDVRDTRLVADGRRGTELRVKAVDGNGTPTMVPGLSWDTPGGR